MGRLKVLDKRKLLVEFKSRVIPNLSLLQEKNYSRFIV